MPSRAETLTVYLRLCNYTCKSLTALKFVTDSLSMYFLSPIRRNKIEMNKTGEKSVIGPATISIRNGREFF